MTLLIVFAFLAGIVTILSPCILPVLPIILSGSVDRSRFRPLGIIIGFVAGFTFFTLFLSLVVRSTGISADSLRLISVVVIATFGLSLVIPRAQLIFERLFSYFSRFSPAPSRHRGFLGGIFIGISLGLLWTPCVGPILASVISLSVTGTVTSQAALITFAYALGAAIPMLIISASGSKLFSRFPWLLSRSATIQRAFGLVMIIVAVGIYFNWDRRFQTFILEKFPNYGVGLTKFEDNPLIKDQLDRLTNPGDNISSMNPAPEIIPGGQWFNLPAGRQVLSLKDLRGKVTLVDFWTYTCVNCIRTLPYLKSWHQKYASSGLVIIGVHTPEFEFEKNPANVKQAVADFGLEYPVVQDNDYATWNAFDNHYWPAKYLIDKDGAVRYTHFGEGAYDDTESQIRRLLAETGSQISAPMTEISPQSNQARTPETYLGYQRISGLKSPEKLSPDRPANYSVPANLPARSFALEGEWTVAPENSVSGQTAALVYRFDAAKVFLVMSSPKPAAVKVFLDGKPISPGLAGADVKDSLVSIEKDRLYHLVNLKEGGVHTLRLEFTPGISIFAFTFG